MKNSFLMILCANKEGLWTTRSESITDASREVCTSFDSGTVRLLVLVSRVSPSGSRRSPRLHWFQLGPIKKEALNDETQAKELSPL